MDYIILIFITPLAINLVVLPMLAALAPKIGLLDYPSSRKVHIKPKARVGGLGIAISLSAACLLFVSSANLRGLYAGGLMMVLIGFVDDAININFRWKLLAQTAAALLVVLGSHAVLSGFGNLFSLGSIGLGVFSIPVTVFCIVGVMNAINMLDGLDSLAGGVVFIAVSSFAVLSYLNHQRDLFLICIALLGALAGFLRYNVHPAKIFMGDSGSLSLGLILAFLSISITQKAGRVPPVAPLVILAIPVLDTVMVMIGRAVRGGSPFMADKTHLHHIFLKAGFNKQRTAKIIILISALLSALAVGGTIYGAPEHHLFILFLVFTVFYVIFLIYIRKILNVMACLRSQSDPGKINPVIAWTARLLARAATVSRKGERIKMESPGDLAGCEGHNFSGKVLEIAPRGFLALTKDALPIEDRLPVAIRLNGSQDAVNISGTAQIRWSQKTDNGEAYYYGFKFIHMDSSQNHALRDYLDTLREQEMNTRRAQISIDTVGKL